MLYANHFIHRPQTVKFDGEDVFGSKSLAVSKLSISWHIVDAFALLLTDNLLGDGHFPEAATVGPWPMSNISLTAQKLLTASSHSVSNLQ